MKHLRILLFPFALIYGIIVLLRHKFYDLGIFKSTEFNLPVICIGNLSFGGTGKSPMLAALVNRFKGEYKIASLSRGYKRQTKGFRIVNLNDEASKVGDEPLQFKTTFKEQIEVAVCEDRVKGVTEILQLFPETEIIILDDAFQHRKISAGLNILLTSYNDLYVDDHLLPVGNLRDTQYAANRAQVIVVTKCPSPINIVDQEFISKRLKIRPEQSLYFSSIVYDAMVYSYVTKMALTEFDDFILITGIANPKPLVEHLNIQNKRYTHHAFADHHHFSSAEINQLKDLKKPILTTSKDFMRLKSHFVDGELYHLPIKSEIIQKEKKFNQEIKDFIDSFEASNQ